MASSSSTSKTLTSRAASSYLFKAGHAIRIALAGADKDHFAPLPGDPPTLRVHRDAAHASHIDLPAMPR
jgi:predicted acyl esterase